MRCLIVILLMTLAASSQAARLKFIGLHSYTSKDLKEAISGRLHYITKRDATVFRADDAAFLVETYLRTHGLPAATASWKLGDNNTIILTIDEGLPTFLGTITVQGYDDHEPVIEQFTAPFPETNKKRAFEAAAVEIGIARVQELLHSKGYWQSKLESVQGDRIANGEIPFTLKITTGPLLTLIPPVLNSTVPPTLELQHYLLEVLGKKASAKNILRIRKHIEEHYRRRGYNQIDVEMEKESNGTNIRLTFTVTPGKKFTIRSFGITGQKKTTPSRLQNRLTPFIGKNYDEDRVNAEIRKLLGTGGFESLRLNSQEANETQLDLTLQVTESNARGYSLAFGFGSIEGYVLGARYNDRNLWGKLWNLSAGIEITSLGVLGEVTRTDPYFLERDLSLNNRAFLISRDFDSYRTLRGGFSNELSWKIGEHYAATIGLENTINAISSTLPDELIGPPNYLNHRLNFRQTYDRRNDPTLPSDGWLARLDTALGFIQGDATGGYIETEAHLSYYRSLGDDTSYALGISGGFITASLDQGQIPIDLRTFLGGANSIRSFPERDLGEQASGNPLGGTSWWVANAEYSHTITGPLRGLFFIDAGSLDDHFELATGLGLRVDLPVGPIRLEYGHSLTRDSGEPAGAFHFAIGATF